MIKMTDAITIWMNSLANRKESTRELYKRHFARFCEWTRKTPDELRQHKFEEDQKNKPWERSTVENLVRRFLRYLTEEKGLTNLNNPYYAIRSFFSSNGMPLNLNNGDTPTNHSSQGSAVPTPEDIKQVLNACDYIRDRGIALFLKDSGLRASDLPQLAWGDLKPLGNGFLAFKIVTAKEGVLARGFVGLETTKVLMVYKKKRMEGTRRIPPEKDIEKHPVFALLHHPDKGMAPVVISARLSYIFRLAGMREKDVSAHGLRKFWEQHVHAKKESYIKQLNGRALSKVEKAYDWLTSEQLFEIYQRNYDNLKVLSTPIAKEVKELEQRLRREYEEKNKKLSRELESLREDIRILKSSAIRFGPHVIIDPKWGKWLLNEAKKHGLVTTVKQEHKKKKGEKP